MLSKQILHQIPLEHPKAAHEFVESSLFVFFGIDCILKSVNRKF